MNGHMHHLNEKTTVTIGVLRALVTTVLLCASFAFSAGPALASRGHVLGTSFGSRGAGNGQFEDPQGVAVNEVTGQIYVLDQGNGRIERFSSVGDYEAQFDGTETPSKAFAFGGVALNGDIAVDNSCYFKGLSGSACSAADPSNGDVYVGDPGHDAVDKFSPAGAYLGQLREASSAAVFRFQEIEGLSICGVGVDANGTVWVYETGGTSKGMVDSFTDGVEGTFIATSGALRTSNFRLPGFAVDAEDDFYTRGIFPGESNPASYIQTFNRFGVLLPAFTATGEPEIASAPAVDLASDEVFIDNIGSISVFGRAGALQERFGSGVLTEGSGLAVNHEHETVYVADAAADTIDVFVPEPPSAPTVEGESVSAVASTSATLGGEIDPRGAASEYRFEYGRCATPSTCSSSGYEGRAPVPDAPLGADFEVHSPSVHIQGLQPGTAYHFRVVAHNEINQELKTVAGAEQTFVTQVAGSAFALPDGREWELVSPPEKHGAVFQPNEEAPTQAAVSGNAMTYIATLPTEEGVKGYEYNGVQVLSTRGPSGWSSHDVSLPHGTPTAFPGALGKEYRYFSLDLTVGVAEPLGPFTSLAPEAFPPDTERTPYLRHDTTCDAVPSTCYEPLVTGAPGYADVPEGTKFGGDNETGGGRDELGEAIFVAGTPDLSHAILASSVPLTDTSTGGHQQLYEWSAASAPSERIKLVSVLPPNEKGEEASAHGNAALGFATSARHAISDDGSRVVWTEAAGATGPALYMRDIKRNRTVRLDVPQAECQSSGECGSGEASPMFQTASSDGSRVFFTDTQRLTKDASSVPGARDLYECEMVEVGDAPTCDLTDLTPGPSAEEGANVQGAVIGASEDGSWVYFVANGVLGDGAEHGAIAGNCKEATGKGSCDLYVWHDGTVALVAVLSGEDFPDWAASEPSDLTTLAARVSPNGDWLTFMSDRPLAGYDNRDTRSGKPDEEVYLYHANTTGGGDLTCASCDPTGARPAGVEYPQIQGKLTGGFRVWEERAWIAANVPAWTTSEQNVGLYQPRYLSDRGRVFFNSSDALVPGDINNNEDVYEYEPVGVGDCSSSSSTFSERSAGCIALISSGTAAGESAFLDASEDGNDVFFLTAEKLVSQDIDTALDVYDAHVCSSALPCVASPAVPPACTTADACRVAPSPQPAIFGAPSSATFTGAGNLTQPGPSLAVKRRSLTPAQRLARAFAACHRRKIKQKRRACERQARTRYRNDKQSGQKAGKGANR
jgi:DNA-binding beta-propeller fold protein YncE